MEYLFIYGLQVFEMINLAAVTFLIISVFIAIFLVIYGLDNKGIFVTDKYDYYKEERELFNSVKGLFKKFIVIGLILLFVPTNQTLLLLGGTYLGKKAVKSVITDKKIEKINTIIELELDKRIKELGG
jgi:hypothetical protein